MKNDEVQRHMKRMRIRAAQTHCIMARDFIAEDFPALAREFQKQLDILSDEEAKA